MESFGFRERELFAELPSDLVFPVLDNDKAG
jgi:hypothetical protein